MARITDVMPELRRQSRVLCHTKVRLRSADREHSVVARVQNLSLGGIYVTAPEIPAAGSEVLCRLFVAGERRTLRGLVAWVQPPGADPEGGPGAGIRFMDLTRQDADLLTRLVEPDPSERQPVDIWFEGMPSPIKSLAEIRDEALLVSTELPFLRLSSPVKVSFVRRGVEERRSGFLDSVTLESSAKRGIPWLRLAVSTPAPDSAHGTIEVLVRAQPPLTASSAEPPAMIVDHAAVAPVQPAAPRPELPAIAVPTQVGRKRTRLALFLTGAVAGVSVAAVMSALAVRLMVTTPGGLPEPAVSIAPIAPIPERPAVQIEMLSPPPPASKPASEPGFRPAPVPARGFRVEPGALLIPFAGRLKDIEHYRLADPDGVAVNLPHAKPRVPLGLARNLSADFYKVLVQRRGRGSHLRIFHATSRRAEVSVAGQVLRVVLRAR